MAKMGTERKVTVDPSMAPQNWIETRPGVFQTRHPRTGQPFGGEFRKQPDGRLVPASGPAKLGQMIDTGVDFAASTGRGLLGMDPTSLAGASGEGYRTGQALSNMPGPQAVAKVAGKLPGMMEEVGGTLAFLAGKKSKDPMVKGLLGSIAELQNQGKSASEIREAFPKLSLVNIGGEWAVEMPDNASMFKKSLPVGKAIEGTVKDLFSHKQLEKSYPDVANLKLKMKIDPNSEFPSGSFQVKDGVIEATAKDAIQLRETLTHELEHFIQQAEMWPRGGSPDAMRVGKGAYAMEKRNIFRSKEAALERQTAMMQKAAEYAEKDPEYSKRLQQEAQDYGKLFDRMDKKLATYDRLEAYPKTSEGRIAAYADLWGERAARAAGDRRDMTMEQRAANPIQQDLEGGIIPRDKDRYGDLWKSTPFQEPSLKASDIRYERDFTTGELIPGPISPYTEMDVDFTNPLGAPVRK